MMSYENGRQRAAKIYVSYGKTVLENFEDRAFNGRRGHEALREEVRAGVKTWARARYGAAAKPRVTWAWKLGCDCPCSPGFAVTIKGTHKDMWASRDARNGRRGRFRSVSYGPAEFWAELTDAGQVEVTDAGR